VKRELTILDVFCGAGGLSLGFQRAGYTILCAVDNQPAALKTYQQNIGSHTVHAHLEQDTLAFPRATVVLGGPPCQGFSSAGMRRANDQRNSLVACYANLIASLRPDAFVFENVEGFLTAERGERVIELLTPLIASGYRIHLRKINAANYGVPQHRKRVIAIGGLGWNPSFPEPTHTAFGSPGAHLALKYAQRTPTICEALQTLPPPAHQPPGSPQGHFSLPLQNKELERAIALKPGQTMKDLPLELQHESYRRRAFRRVKDGTPTERRGGAPAGIRRLLPDEPAKAITGGAVSEFLHPVENRPLTLRECARLQTFPDTFIFSGSNAEQAQLIGNAVPPLLAQIIASNLAQDLARLPDEKLLEGRLLSFVPTLSKGYSPILKHVTEQVLSSFMQAPEAVMENLTT
jgi:DNA (cytosine-5)-methyltransferase 1